jgi:hypothetical protein
MRRRPWRARALAGLVGLIISFGMSVDLAGADPGGGDETAAEHAEVYQTDGKLRRLSNASGFSDRLYPSSLPVPMGRSS